MFSIKKGQTNTISVSVSLDATISNPYYLFSFVNILSKDTINFVPKNITNGTQDRYNEFEFVEGYPTNLSLDPPQASFNYEGQYWVYIYEQTGSTNTHISGTTSMLYDGRAVVNDTCVPEQYYQYISDNEDNANYIFLASDEVCGVTPTPTQTPSNTPTTTPTITPTPSSTPVPSPTTSPTQTPTTSPTTSPTQTPTTSPTQTPTTTPTITPTTSPTLTPTITPTITPTNTQTPTPTSTLTPTPTPSGTPTLFDVGFGFDGIFMSSVYTEGNDMYFMGQYNLFNGTINESIVKTDLVGNVNMSFNPYVQDGRYVSKIIEADASNFYIVGGFNTLGISPTNTVNFISKISKTTGLVSDANWIATNAQNGVFDIVKDSISGDVIITGSFTSYKGISRGRIARISSSNVLDTTIFAGAGFNGSTYSVIQNLAGNYVIGGAFTTFNGVTQNRIIEIDRTTGLKTALFGTGANSQVSKVIQDSLGNYYIIGNLSTLNGIACGKLTKTDSSGNILAFSNSFPGSIPYGGFLDESNGYIYVSIGTTSIQRFDTATLTRDTAWEALQATIIISSTNTFTPQTCGIKDSTGKIYLIGMFGLWKSQPFNRLVVLDNSGNLLSYV
jgi:hypothetical protein